MGAGHAREGLLERATLLRIAPHVVRPIRFLAPAWGDSPHGVSTLALGVALYDLLAVSASPSRSGARIRIGALTAGPAPL